MTELVSVGQMRDIEFTAVPGDWALHCHMAHHTMNAMGHEVPNPTGVNQNGVAARMRQMRANLLDVLHLDYVTTARAKGLSERQVVFNLEEAETPPNSRVGLMVNLRPQVPLMEDVPRIDSGLSLHLRQFCGGIDLNLPSRPFDKELALFHQAFNLFAIAWIVGKRFDAA